MCDLADCERGENPADSLKSSSSSVVSFHLILFSVFPLFLPSPGEKQPPLAKEGEKEKVAGKKSFFCAKKVGGWYFFGWVVVVRGDAVNHRGRKGKKNFGLQGCCFPPLSSGEKLTIFNWVCRGTGVLLLSGLYFGVFFLTSYRMSSSPTLRFVSILRLRTLTKP